MRRYNAATGVLHRCYNWLRVSVERLTKRGKQCPGPDAAPVSSGEKHNDADKAEHAADNEKYTIRKPNRKLRERRGN